MGASTMSDFAVTSNGHCFFCLNQIMEPKLPQRLSSPLAKQTNSLQYLTRYLKMDLKKVFIDKRQVYPELLAKVEKARLKVELCAECRCLSERFSKVYVQLEKLELELGSTLSLIHGKLYSSSRSDVTEKLRGLTSAFNSNWNGLLEVLDILRVEAVQKAASHKLSNSPRVRIQHLTMTELQAWQPLVQNDKKSSQMSYKGLETSDDKMESLNEDGVTDNESGNYFSEDADTSQNSEPMNDNVEIDNELNEEDDNIVRMKVASRPTRNLVAPGKCSIDPETGKRKCNDCSKEFNSSPGFTQHYYTVHLKLRYKSVACNKLFSRKGSLTLHQRTSRSCAVAESAPKFNCHLCEKSFTHKGSLRTHLEGVHYKLRSNIKTNLTKHKRNVHGMGKTNS